MAKHGEDVDSGLLMLVCLIIKLAQLQPEYRMANASLYEELAKDAASNLVYIAEGAKDDSRCGLGIHATKPTIMDEMDRWGRNQLGHACMAVVAGMKFT